MPALISAEIQHFYDDLDGLNRALGEKTREQFQAATDSLVQEAASRKVAYFREGRFFVRGRIFYLDKHEVP